MVRSAGAVVVVVMGLLVAPMLLLGVAWAADGDLDPTFGDDGLVVVPLDGERAGGSGITIDGAGRAVVVGGGWWDAGLGMAVARLLPDGELDMSWVR